MPFYRNKEGRPEGTEATSDGWILHYTCNAPSSDILKRCNIKSVGEDFDVESNEVLVIPIGLMSGRGDPENTVGVENLLRDLSSKNG